jgi:hypothetical protein
VRQLASLTTGDHIDFPVLLRLNRDVTNILIADRPGAWRTTFGYALEAEGETVAQTEDGKLLLAQLNARTNPPELVVIGSDLAQVGGLEALYLAGRTGLPLVKKILLVTDVLTDLDQLTLWRRRGVSNFLSRDASIEATTAKTLGVLYAEKRAQLRISTEIEVEIAYQSDRLNGVIEDLAFGGAQVVIAGNKLEQEALLGEVLELKFGKGRLEVHCLGRVRRSNRRKLQAEEQVLGIQFESMDPAERGALQRLVESELEG